MRWFWRAVVLLLLSLASTVKADGLSERGTIVSYIGPSGSYNSSLLLTPASTMKVLTATAAIKSLGADFRFQTVLSVKRGSKGLHLRLQMNGDPSFSSEDLSALLAALRHDMKQTTVRSIEVIDSAFTGHSRSRGQVWNDIGVCFAAPVTALSIDGNCVYGNLKPGRVGQLSSLHVSDSQLLAIDNQIVTVAADTADCQQNLLVGEHNRYRLTGCMPANASMMPLRFSINDERAYFALKLKRSLRAQGFKLNAEPQFTSGLEAYSQSYIHRSAALIELLTTMLVESDNLYADSIFKTLAIAAQRPANYEVASEVLIGQLEQLGIDVTRLQIRDGSGLSRENLVSAKALYQVLQLWQQDPQLQPLISRLAIAGQSGTLRYRHSLTKTPLKGHIHAKSGYVNGVVNLVGYIEKDGQYSPFVLLTNGVVLTAEEQLALRKRQIIHPVLSFERDWLEQQWQLIK
ncbi:D-alanyl-D-alanine carboxypeptidase/D-alanyl-D-alanine endopeptidase [Agarivorans gilvus]|nr:D-alanyl-D-alanine carboxypeptidase/D-alanyl-D-alanine-endopeptidase [Agarivorans gilvus]